MIMKALNTLKQLIKRSGNPTGGAVEAKAEPIGILTMRVYRAATGKWEDIK
jgi:hypothetical protein